MSDFDVFEEAKPPARAPNYHDYSEDWPRRNSLAYSIAAQMWGGDLHESVTLFNPTTTQVVFTVGLGWTRADQQQQQGMREADEKLSAAQLAKHFERKSALNIRVTVPSGARLVVPKPFVRATHAVRRTDDGSLMVVSGAATMLRILDASGKDITPPLHPSLMPSTPQVAKLPEKFRVVAGAKAK